MAREDDFATRMTGDATLMARPLFLVNEAVNDIAHGGTVDIMHLSKLSHADIGSLELLTKFLSLFVRECRIPTSLALRSTRSALFYLVLNICNIVPQKQMGWIAARGIVTFVAYMQAIWDWAVMKFIREPMGAHALIAQAEHSIACVIGVCFPSPAFVMAAFVNIRPKTLCQWSPLQSSPMAVKESTWLAFDPSSSLVCAVCDLGLLPTATMTIAVGNFVLGHKNTSCRMTEHALAEGAGRRQEARNNYSFAQLFRQLTITLSTYDYSTSGLIREVAI